MFELENKNVLVYGTGKSGIGAAKLLLKAGAVPVLYDGNTELDPEEICKKVGAQVRVVLGEFPAGEVGEMDLLIMSPGISCEMPLVEEFRKRNLSVWGELELAYRTGRGHVMAVTGTNGKTTTVTLLGEIMQDHYREVYTVGNIGIPYTDVSMRQSDEAWTVAEVSSFQLETIDTFHPQASAITNITEDHLNRHHTMEEYIRVKERIAENQTEGEICVLNYEDAVLRAFGEAQTAVRVIWFSSVRKLEKGLYLDNDAIMLADEDGVRPVMRLDELQILGQHNHENVMTAIAMAYYGGGVPLEEIRKTVMAFGGVAHRIEFVDEIDGVRYYNDSKGTNPDAAIRAVRAMKWPTMLIGGGFDKGSTYSEWINSFGDTVRYLALIGQTREKIAEEALACGFPKEQIGFYENLKEATLACAQRAKSGEAVLLSPACASWGQFDNYEQRGDMFKKYVKELAAAAK